MNLAARISEFFVTDPVERVNRAARREALRQERRHWTDELRKAERRARECRDELSKLDEIEATR